MTLDTVTVDFAETWRYYTVNTMFSLIVLLMVVCIYLESIPPLTEIVCQHHNLSKSTCLWKEKYLFGKNANTGTYFNKVGTDKYSVFKYLYTYYEYKKNIKNTVKTKIYAYMKYVSIEKK